MISTDTGFSLSPLTRTTGPLYPTSFLLSFLLPVLDLANLMAPFKSRWPIFVSASESMASRPGPPGGLLPALRFFLPLLPLGLFVSQLTLSGFLRLARVAFVFPATAAERARGESGPTSGCDARCVPVEPGLLDCDPVVPGAARGELVVQEEAGLDAGCDAAARGVVEQLESTWSSSSDESGLILIVRASNSRFTSGSLTPPGDRNKNH